MHVWPVGAGGRPGASKWIGLRTIEGRAPMPRSYHCAVAVGSKLVIFGGSSGERTYGDVAYLECTPTVSSPDTWSWHWPAVAAGAGPRPRVPARGIDRRQ